MGRGALHMTVTLADDPWRLVTAHLRSKLLSFPGGRFNPTDEAQRARFGAYAMYRRAAEAATVRAAATRILHGQGRTRPLIVLGDLNDSPAAATTQMLYGPPGSQYDTGGFDHPDQGDATRLWNLAPHPRRAPLQPSLEGQPELIDHILIIHTLLDRLQSVDSHTDGLPSITADPNARRDAPASDHAPWWPTSAELPSDGARLRGPAVQAALFAPSGSCGARHRGPGAPGDR
jgi:hypothetical protein